MAKKVLVVNDSPSFRRQLFWSLHEDFQVLEAQEREEALEQIEEQRPDILLLDLYLSPKFLSPEEGFILLKEVKKRYPEIRVIIISSVQDPDIINQAKCWGSEGYIIKPFNIEELKKILEQELKKPTRRKWQRMKMSLPVEYQYKVDFEVKRSTQTRDISLGGVMMPVDRPIHLFTKLNLWLSLPSQARPLEARGQVRWTSRIEGYDYYHVGIQFTKLEEESRSLLKQYLFMELH
jgi:response regulator of citrate/malate metabolism